MQLCHSGAPGASEVIPCRAWPETLDIGRHPSGPEPDVTQLRMIMMPALALVALTACSVDTDVARERNEERRMRDMNIESDESFFDLFRDRGDPEIGIQVNRYLWQASLDTLSFLPLAAVDPFSGIIETGMGSVNGAPYRVTVYISSPALDAVSLKVAAFRGSVPVGAAENAQLENAILTRARQLRIAASQR